jgi:hypothetical protein
MAGGISQSFGLWGLEQIRSMSIDLEHFRSTWKDFKEHR